MKPASAGIVSGMASDNTVIPFLKFWTISLAGGITLPSLSGFEDCLSAVEYHHRNALFTQD
jgi:hypothetical protein